MVSGRSGKTAYIAPHRTVFKVPLGLGRHPFDFLTHQMENWKDYNFPDYYNYGFNSQTIVPYILLLKKFAEAQNIGTPLDYSTHESELLMLNDEVPMDFGGFSPPIDQDLFDVPGCSSFSKGEPLFKCLV